MTMAEPVSAVVALATVSLAIIKRTAIFIQDARDVDTLVLKLFETLRDLRRLIKTVDTTCRRATSTDDDPSRFIEHALIRCHSRLEAVEGIVKDLASRSTSTFLKKVALKIRSDRSRKEIEEAISDLNRLMDQIHKGISCWSL